MTMITGLFAPKVEKLEWKRDALTKKADAKHSTTDLLPFVTPMAATAYYGVKHVLTDVAIPVTTNIRTPITDGLWPIVTLMQDAALPAFVCLALYGAYEWVLDHKEGKNRIWRAVMAYISVFIIPIGFRAVQVALGGISL